MSKSIDDILILPGEAGWEVWSRLPEGGFSRLRVSECLQAGELDELPAGQLTMLFAAKAVTALPMRVMTDDDALFGDLVTLHAERLGLRTDPMAGQLSDIFPVEKAKDSSVLLAVFLRPPAEGELPRRGPKAFDLLARCLPVDGDAVCVWKELGRWVFGVYHRGKLLHVQATSIESAMPDSALARELRLSLMQLSLQGLDFKPSRIEVWTADGKGDVSAWQGFLDLPVRLAARPMPVLPEAMSRLLPEDVRAARDEARRRQVIRLSAAAVALAYLGTIGWLGFGLWQGARHAEELKVQARQAAPDAEAYALHMKKWRELQDGIELNHSPVEMLLHIANCIPPQGSLHLESADISASAIVLSGSGAQLQDVNRFSLNLTKHSGLSRLTWTTPEPSQSTGGWKFTYRAELPVAAP